MTKDLVTLEEFCQGHCPKCDSVNLDYQALETEADFIWYPFTCNDCGIRGEENYKLDYTDTSYIEEINLKNK